MEKLSPNRVQLFVCNKYTVFTMGGTAALRSVNKNFSGELQFCSYLISVHEKKKSLQIIPVINPARGTSP